MSSFSSAKDDAAFRDIMFCEYLDELDLKQAQRDEVAAYASEHPGVLEGFDPMAYLADHYGYQDPKTAFMEDYGLSDDQEFLEYLQYAYISALKARQERAARIADYEAANPGSTADFDADAYFAENYSYYTKERFMLNQELDTEEDFHDYLLCEWIDYQEYGDWWWVAPADYDAEKELLGGVPGELGIMVNGVYLQFGSDQKPYAQDGTTFVPSEILAQALGRHPRPITTNGYSPLRSLRRGGRLYRLLGSKLRDRCSAGARRRLRRPWMIVHHSQRGAGEVGPRPRGRITRPTAPSLWIPPSSTPSTGTRPMPSPPPSASFSPPPAWNSPAPTTSPSWKS